MTNWSTLRPLILYTTHQEFLTRPLEVSDQRLRGQLVIILQLHIIRGDALKDSHHISRVKQPNQDDIWKMSNLGFGRILSLIYLSRRLSYLWKVSLFFSVCPLNMKWGCWEFLSCLQLVPGYHWSAGSKIKCLYTWNGRSNFFSCWSELTCRLKPDNPHHFRTSFSGYKSLSSLLASSPFDFKSRESRGYLKWEEKIIIQTKGIR